MYNECDSQTSWHKITMIRLTCLNQSNNLSIVKKIICFIIWKMICKSLSCNIDLFCIVKMTDFDSYCLEKWNK